MNCDNCVFPFSKIYTTCQGYAIFDEHYNFEIYRFCSLNCGLKFIIDSKTELVKKLKNFFDFYNIDSKSIKMALPKERLLVFDGDLSYTEYRKDFVCPFVDTSYGYDENFITYVLDENKFSEES